MTKTELPTLEKLYKGSSETERSAEGRGLTPLEPLSETTGPGKELPGQTRVSLLPENKSRALEKFLERAEFLWDLSEAAEVLLNLFLH